jgi:hypothetical protein
MVPGEFFFPVEFFSLPFFVKINLIFTNQKEETIMISKKTIWFLVGVSLVLFSSTIVVAEDEQLYGTWRLVSYKRTVLATGETTDMLGKSPQGFINYGRDGRVLVLVVREDRPKPADYAKIPDQERAELHRTMFSYGGTYTYDGKTVTHHIDISWNETWTGTKQVRDVKFAGSKLILTTSPVPNPMDGKVGVAVLTWERAQ